MRRSRRRSRIAPGDPLAMVGWVFADLLLGVALVFLGTQPGDPSAGRVPKAPATTTTTTTTTTTAPTSTTTTTTTLPPSVDRAYRCLRISTDPRSLGAPPGPERDAYARTLADQLAQMLHDSGFDHRRAGIVLAFGTAQDSGVGKRYAQQFIDLVLPLLPNTFATSATRPFWGAGSDSGSVELDIYPLVGPGQTSLGVSNDC